MSGKSSGPSHQHKDVVPICHLQHVHLLSSPRSSAAFQGNSEKLCESVERSFVAAWTIAVGAVDGAGAFVWISPSLVPWFVICNCLRFVSAPIILGSFVF